LLISVNKTFYGTNSVVPYQVAFPENFGVPALPNIPYATPKRTDQGVPLLVLAGNKIIN
jgi:hypothetical protein